MKRERKTKVLKPQEGYQTKFLSSPADIVIGGGAAGAGKTASLLLEAVRGIKYKGYRAVIFRRTMEQVKKAGSIWDSALRFYEGIYDKANLQSATIKFGEASISFSHLQYDKDKLSHQGAEYAFIGFDELTHFTEGQFLYLLSRNRSVCGYKPCIRATCNPDPDSWVSKFISWWIGDDGFPIKERDGVLRYFMINDGEYVWGDSYEEVYEKMKHVIDPLLEVTGGKISDFIKTVTFIAGDIFGNKKLLEANPEYLGNLNAQSAEDKMSLLYGNWKKRTDNSGMISRDKIAELFTFKDKPFTDGKRYISVDVARYGKDMSVIMIWENFTCISTFIYTKNSLTELVDAIELIRETYGIPKINVVVDDGGVGGGVTDIGNYNGFNGAKSPIECINETTNYNNLKAQTFYFGGRLVNLGLIKINNRFTVDGQPQTKIKGKLIADMIFEELSVLKEVTTFGKKQVMSKDDMKKVIGRSPDFLDTIMMRAYLSLNQNIKPWLQELNVQK